MSLYYSSGRLPAVFHYVDGFSHDFQLDGHNQSSNTSAGQSRLLHLFSNRVGQQTGIVISTSYNYAFIFFTIFFLLVCYLQKQASGQVATMLCLSHCQVANGQAFSLSGRIEGRSQRIESTSCANDYIVFPGGFSFPMTEPVNQRDRFCGTIFSQMEEADTEQTICSTTFYCSADVILCIY